MSKAALRRLRDVAGESNRPAASSVLAVYTALCEIASDCQAEVFEAYRSQIAGKSCLDVRTVDKVLPILTAAGLLDIQRRKSDSSLNLPSVYTLLSYGSEIKSPPSEIKSVAKRDESEAITLFRRIGRIGEESEESIAPASAVEGKPAPSGSSKAPKAAKTKKPRERNPLMDALAAIDGSDPARVTGSAWGAIAKALKEIREVSPDVTPTEIKRRAGNYRQQFEGAAITATALEKHWARCDRASAQSQNQPAIRFANA